jgi:hypothetical protein
VHPPAHPGALEAVAPHPPPGRRRHTGAAGERGTAGLITRRARERYASSRVCPGAQWHVRRRRGRSIPPGARAASRESVLCARRDIWRPGPSSLRSPFRHHVSVPPLRKGAAGHADTLRGFQATDPSPRHGGSGPAGRPPRSLHRCCNVPATSGGGHAPYMRVTGHFPTLAKDRAFSRLLLMKPIWRGGGARTWPAFSRGAQ